jgi:hypothetical protein
MSTSNDVDRNSLSRQAFAVQLGKDAPQVIEYRHTVKRSRASRPADKREVATSEEKTVTQTVQIVTYTVHFDHEKMHHRDIPPNNVTTFVPYQFPLAMVGKLTNEQRVYLLQGLAKLGVKLVESDKSVITTTAHFADTMLSNRAMRRILTNVNAWLMSQGFPYLAVLMTRDKGKLSKLQLCAVTDYPDSRVYEK